MAAAATAATVSQVASTPPILRLLKPLGLIAMALAVLLAVSSFVHLQVPELSGSLGVGRQSFVWTDRSRPEPATAHPHDHREIGLVVWYPAQPGTGARAAYVPGLAAIEAGLVASGELSSAQVFGLRWVRSRSFEAAAVAPTESGHPLLLLSPGNATNVEFYGALAEDLASHGYVVVGLNHPFQVTAMSLSDGSLAVYDDLSHSEAGSVAAKISQRVEDVGFVLDRVRREVGAGSFLAGEVDLSRVGILGHSNGGLTAVEVCRAETAVVACMNIDGQAAAGPFGTGAEPVPVGDPFMYLTKETEIHPALAATFEQSGPGTFRVVVPAATHQQFADGPLYEPGWWPFDRAADHVHTVTRGFARAFFDQFLSGAPQPLEIVEAPTDVYLYGYPLGAR